MSIEYIRDSVAGIKRRFGNAAAEEVCDALGIITIYQPMGAVPESCKGFFLRQSRKKVICINSELAESHQRIILPHELGHGVLHGNTARECAFHDFALFDTTAQTEYEANIFAAEFLMSDDEVLDLGNQGYYWSNMLDNENPRNANTLVFSSEDIKTSSSFRHLGIPVRPVRAAEQ
jgi:Zn-dependent peptidase ImmA (M78 family)